MKFPDKPMYTIYGLPHLLRFISKHDNFSNTNSCTNYYNNTLFSWY